MQLVNLKMICIKINILIKLITTSSKTKFDTSHCPFNYLETLAL